MPITYVSMPISTNFTKELKSFGLPHFYDFWISIGFLNSLYMYLRACKQICSTSSRIEESNTSQMSDLKETARNIKYKSDYYQIEFRQSSCYCSCDTYLLKPSNRWRNKFDYGRISNTCCSLTLGCLSLMTPAFVLFCND